MCFFLTSNDDVVESDHHHPTNINSAYDHFDPQDMNCPFRDSPLYRSIYVYPSPNEKDLWEQGKVDGIVLETDDDIAARNRNNFTTEDFWPWLHINEQSKKYSKFHYDILNPASQYNTELLVKEIITHPKSCLRSYNPETAKLFYPGNTGAAPCARGIWKERRRLREMCFL